MNYNNTQRKLKPDATCYMCILLIFMSSFLFQAVDDDIPEEKHLYELSLTSLTPAADISPSRQRATITMAASDLPYGLFSFSQSSLSIIEEDRSVRNLFIQWLSNIQTLYMAVNWNKPEWQLVYIVIHWHSWITVRPLKKMPCYSLDKIYCGFGNTNR